MSLSLSEKIEALAKLVNEHLSTTSGQGLGKHEGWAMAVGVIGVVLTVLSIASAWPKMIFETLSSQRFSKFS
jgi:hypothetical protein